MFATYLTGIAEEHRRKAITADTAAERDHWRREAARFAVLAGLASEDEAAARAAYRPTVAYQPEV